MNIPDTQNKHVCDINDNEEWKKQFLIMGLPQISISIYQQHVFADFSTFARLWLSSKVIDNRDYYSLRNRAFLKIVELIEFVRVR